MFLLKSFSPRFSLFAACLSLLSFGGAAFAQAPSPVAVPQIVTHVDEGHLATLSGNTRPEATAKNDVGHVAADLQMGDLFLVLKRSPAMQAAADKYLADLYDSNSPNFHHWITPE